LIFENRQTLWFRIQEVLRVARLVDPIRVREELGLYNRLLPASDTLQAALVIDVVEGPNWADEVRFWDELRGEHLRIVAGKMSAPARLVTCRPEDRCTGAAYWLTFTVNGDARAALADNLRPVFIAAEYQTYQHRSPTLSEPVRLSLIDDLDLSDRDGATPRAA
jgi:hypothetical protein